MAITATDINTLSVEIETERDRRIAYEGGASICVDIALAPGDLIDDAEFDAFKVYFQTNIPVITDGGYAACPTNYTAITDYNEGTTESNTNYTDIAGESNWYKLAEALPPIFPEDIDETEEITTGSVADYETHLATLEGQCACNCNYCTCECNYCTCNCNYCTCECNYCTCVCNNCSCNAACTCNNQGYCACDCAYCTCNCNYCTCNCNYCTCNCDYCTCQCNYSPCK